MTSIQAPQTPVILCIMDGWGSAQAGAHNAVSAANTPTIDALMASVPHAALSASGPDVGLPEGQPGNSEVGHLTIGSGRLIEQDLPRIDGVIARDGLADMAEMQAFLSAMKTSGGAVHLLGLLSDGGVHAHSRHIRALANLLAASGLLVHVHMFTDGRDTMPKIADKMLADFQNGLDETVQISTVTGRYFAMDRDKRWARTQIARDVILHGKAPYQAADAAAAVQAAYERGEQDEFMQATSVDDYQGMADGDGVIIANFRVDRARQIMAGFFTPELTDLPEANLPQFAAALAMTPLSDTLDVHVPYLFGPPDLSQGLGATVSGAGMTQLRIAETEKYPHVTFFFNGGVEAAFAGESRTVVPSPQVATYDLQPEMSAAGVCNRAEQAITDKECDLVIINFANPDMVGHTGDVQAAIQAVECVDGAVGRLVAAIEAHGGVMLVTADHGNCEVMWDEDNHCPHTAHTTNLVPLMLVGAPDGYQLADGTLADLAPSLLDLLGLEQPDVMTGKSLIRRS